MADAVARGPSGSMRCARAAAVRNDSVWPDDPPATAIADARHTA
ncbi:DUF6053 domain-containing protein [Lysobacter enzymogenes]